MEFASVVGGNPLVPAVIAGLAILLFFIGLHRVISGRLDLNGRLTGYATSRPRHSDVDVSRRRGIGKRLENALANRSFGASVQRDLARANLRLTVGEYVFVHIGAMVVGGAVGAFVLRSTPIGLVLVILGFYMPRLYVGLAQRRRLSAFNSQLADTIALLANSLRAGFSLLQAMETVSREAQAPTGEEFGRVVREVSLGLSPEAALANLVRRMESDDLDMAVTAINVQHEVGGNLAKVLDSIATTIRERVRIRGEIRSLTSQQRLSGYVISLLPVALAAGLFVVNPGYVGRLFSTEIFLFFPIIVLPIFAGMMILSGFLVMRKIMEIEV